MHSLHLKVQDNVYEHIIYLLKSIGKNDIEITKDYFENNNNSSEVEKLEELFLNSNNKITVTKDLAIDTDGMCE